MRIFYQFLILIVLGAAALTVSSFVRAQTVDDLKEKISTKTDELQKLETDIKQTEKNIDETVAKKKTLGTEIQTLDLTRKKLETDIKITQTKVDTTDLKIRQLSSDIAYKEDEIDSRIFALREVLRSVYEYDARSLAEVALSNESFSGFWDDIEALDQFSSHVEENVEVLKSLKTDLEGKNEQKQTEKSKLLGLKGELGDRKKITEDNKKQKAKLLVQTSNQETKYQKELRQKLALKEALEGEIRDYESTLKFILDPTTIPPRGTKVLDPPVDSVYITQQFGKTSASGRLYASGTHNGTDFRATTGTQVKAMRGGIVIGTGDTDLTCPGASFGKWVLVDHQNGLASSSAHLSLIKVSAGETVSGGQLLGYSGNTGYSTGPHLHISVYARKAVQIETRPSKACGGRSYTMPIAALNGYLDPMDYIKI